MTSILVSSDDQNTTTDFAKELAKALDFSYLGLPFLKTVAKRYNTTEDKLQKALNWLLSSRILSAKSIDIHLAYLQEAVLERFLKDNIVCGGLAAHLYIKGVSHILNVRVFSENHKQKNRQANERNGYLKNFRKIIDKASFIRTGNSNDIYLYDENDASQYDVALSIEKIGFDKIVETITTMAKDRKFKPMTYSRKTLKDLTLASKLRVLLLPKFSDFRVVANDSTAVVNIKCTKRQKAKTAGEIKVIANKIPEIKFVEVHALSKLPSLYEGMEPKGNA